MQSKLCFVKRKHAILDRPAISKGQRGRAIILVLLVGVIWVIVVLTVFPWLRATFGVPVATAIGAAAALSLMAYCVRFLIRMQRGFDEVQRASIAFSAQWGQSAAQIGFVVLLLLPPFHEFATTLISRFVGDSGTPIDRQVVGLAMTFAFVTIAALQGIALLVFSVIWWVSRR